MSIQTTPILNDDGKPMTPDQVEISRLKKANATLQQELSELIKRVDALEAKQKNAAFKERRAPQF
jgi:FtsZ-binding cell division protein ZapB